MKVLSKLLMARDLPPEWQKEGGFAPHDRVTVTVTEENGALSTLRAGLDEAAAQLDRGEGRPFDKEAVQAIIAEIEAQSGGVR